MNDRFHYDALVDDALRSVVRNVLRQVADKGLPGSHHFYISFRSTDPGVQLPEYLRTKYPEEMTIVLQHQYWDLIITEDHFEVTVSFNKQQERIKVPFAALSAFVDPSVRFGLQFDRKDKPGTGEINYDHVLKVIDDAGYQGWIGCDYRPSTTTLGSFRWMKHWDPVVARNSG